MGFFYYCSQLVYLCHLFWRYLLQFLFFRAIKFDLLFINDLQQIFQMLGLTLS